MMFSGYYTYLGLLSFSPCLVLLLHSALARAFHFVRSVMSPLEVATLAVLAGYPVMGFALWQCHLRFLSCSELFWPTIYALVVYSSLSFCYFILFTMTETARRIHILRRLQEKGPMSLRDLSAEYTAAGMLSVRLERMVALKQLKHDNGKFFIKNTLLYWAGSVLVVWAKLLRFSANK